MPGWIVVDEFHHTKSVEAPPFPAIHALQKYCAEGIPFCVFMSGTPLETGPANFLGPLSCLLDPDLESPSFSGASSHNVTMEDIRRNEKAFRSIQESVKRKGTNESDSEKLRDIAEWFMTFLPTWCLRRSERAKWFGQDLLTLPQCHHQIVYVPFPRSLRSDLTKLEDQYQGLGRHSYV